MAIAINLKRGSSRPGRERRKVGPVVEITLGAVIMSSTGGGCD